MNGRYRQVAAYAALCVSVVTAFAQGGTGDADYGKVVPSEARAFAKSVLLVSADAEGTRSSVDALTDADVKLEGRDEHFCSLRANGATFVFNKGTGKLRFMRVSPLSLTVPEHPLSDSDLVANADAYLGLLKPKEESLEARQISADSATVTFAIMHYLGQYRLNTWDRMVLSKATGKLLSLEFTSWDGYGPLVKSAIVSQDEAACSGYDAYSRYKPFSRAELLRAELLLGIPWRGTPVATEWSDQETAWVDAQVLVPFYRFRIKAANGATQDIDVNAIDGHVMSILAVGSSNAASQTTPMGRTADLMAVSLAGGKATGGLAAMEGKVSGMPTGSAVVLVAGKALLAGVATPDGKVWLNQDGRWKAYRPAKALAKEIKTLTKKPAKPFGGKKLAKAG